MKGNLYAGLLISGGVLLVVVSALVVLAMNFEQPSPHASDAQLKQISGTGWLVKSRVGIRPMPGQKPTVTPPPQSIKFTQTVCSFSTNIPGASGRVWTATDCTAGLPSKDKTCLTQVTQAGEPNGAHAFLASKGSGGVAPGLSVFSKDACAPTRGEVQYFCADSKRLSSNELYFYECGLRHPRTSQVLGSSYQWITSDCAGSPGLPKNHKYCYATLGGSAGILTSNSPNQEAFAPLYVTASSITSMPPASLDLATVDYVCSDFPWTASVIPPTPLYVTAVGSNIIYTSARYSNAPFAYFPAPSLTPNCGTSGADGGSSSGYEAPTPNPTASGGYATPAPAPSVGPGGFSINTVNGGCGSSSYANIQNIPTSWASCEYDGVAEMVPYTSITANGQPRVLTGNVVLNYPNNVAVTDVYISQDRSGSDGCPNVQANGQSLIKSCKGMGTTCTCNYVSGQDYCGGYGFKDTSGQQSFSSGQYPASLCFAGSVSAGCSGWTWLTYGIRVYYRAPYCIS